MTLSMDLGFEIVEPIVSMDTSNVILGLNFNDFVF